MPACLYSTPSVLAAVAIAADAQCVSSKAPLLLLLLSLAIVVGAVWSLTACCFYRRNIGCLNHMWHAWNLQHQMLLTGVVDTSVVPDVIP